MIVTKRIQIRSQGHGDTIDITPQVLQELAVSGVTTGTITLFLADSTAGVTTMEFEPGLVKDFQEMWQRVAPEGIPYNHDRRWGDGNGYSHVRASLLGPYLGVPFEDKRLALGAWQQIVVLDFDNRPRTREIVVQITGE